jgi:hypothetical protein
MKAPFAAIVLAEVLLAIRPADACVEVSPVVGYRRCSAFGAGWDSSHAVAGPPLFVRPRRNPLAPTTYRPGSLVDGADDASGGGRRLGCLEVRAERMDDSTVPAGSVVVAFSFGNACDHPVRIALQNIRVVAEREFQDDSPSEPLKLYDPASEVVTMSLDGRDQAREVLEFDSPARESPAAPTACIDLTRAAPDALPTTLQPICTSAARGRADEHEVIGHNWSVSYEDGWGPRIPLFVEFQASAQTVNLGEGSYDSNAGDTRTYTLNGNALGRTVSYAADFRVSARFAGPVYAGILFRVGGGRLVARSASPIDVPGVRLEGGLVNADVGLLIGATVAHWQGARIRAEVGAGGRLLAMGVASTTCKPDVSCNVLGYRGLLEPRLVLDTWITPWWSLGASLGLDAVGPAGALVGLSLAFHVRGFDGGP